MFGKILDKPFIFWSVLFTLIPLCLIVFFCFTTSPFGLDQVDYSFSLENLQKVFEPMYMKIMLKSFQLALIATVICLLLGYPLAYKIANTSMKWQQVMVMLVVVPMWMNFLLRTYAWLLILGTNGYFNMFLDFIGLPKIEILFTDAAVVLGMVYNFLPFMVLPIFTVLRKMDNKLVDAAKDLGATDSVVFRRIIFPLSIPGIVSGVSMVFMPAASTFVISSLLGGGQYMLIGNLIEEQFMRIGDWHFGSALSIILMIFILISMIIMNKYDSDEGSSGLW